MAPGESRASASHCTSPSSKRPERASGFSKGLEGVCMCYVHKDPCQVVGVFHGFKSLWAPNMWTFRGTFYGH